MLNLSQFNISNPHIQGKPHNDFDLSHPPKFDEFQCLICSNMVTNPLCCGICEQGYCFLCVQQNSDKLDVCKCGHELELRNPSKFYQKMLNEFESTNTNMKLEQSQSPIEKRDNPVLSEYLKTMKGPKVSNGISEKDACIQHLIQDSKRGGLPYNITNPRTNSKGEFNNRDSTFTIGSQFIENINVQNETECQKCFRLANEVPRGDHTPIKCIQNMFTAYETQSTGKYTQISRLSHYIHRRLTENAHLFFKNCVYCNKKMCEIEQKNCQTCKIIICGWCIRNNYLFDSQRKEVTCLECHSNNHAPKNSSTVVYNF